MPVLDEISLLANVATHMYLDILTSTPSIELFYMFFSQFQRISGTVKKDPNAAGYVQYMLPWLEYTLAVICAQS